MPTEFVRGDLFHHAGLEALAHGCNCTGAMGKGIALEFRSRFPVMYQEYRRRCRDGAFQLGDVFTWDQASPIVFNLGTQRSWRTNAELPAIRCAVARMVLEAEKYGISTVGLPRIGAGLGGLRWNDVRRVLDEVGSGTDVRLVVFEEFEAAS